MMTREGQAMTATISFSATDRSNIDAAGDRAAEASKAYVLVSVRWSWPGSTRAVKGDLREGMAEELEASAAAVSASTRMYDCRIAELTRLRQLKRAADAWCDLHTL